MRVYVEIDGYKYAVVQGTYLRRWDRAFTSQLAANIIRLNFVDRGPGIRVYTMTLELADWPTDSEVYQSGITQTLLQQKTNLEASYGKIATAISFVDPLGDSPGASGKVYFTSLRQLIPNWSSVQKPYLRYDIELTESTQIISG